MIENKKGGVFSLRNNRITPIPEKQSQSSFFRRTLQRIFSTRRPRRIEPVDIPQTYDVLNDVCSSNFPDNKSKINNSSINCIKLCEYYTKLFRKLEDLKLHRYDFYFIYILLYQYFKIPTNVKYPKMKTFIK